MKIYEINDKSAYCKPYAWASGYGPINDMPFLSPTFLEKRKKYWEINPSLGGLEIDSGASRWPDLLGCGHPPPAYFTAERVYNSFKALRTIFSHTTPIPIAKVESKKLRDSPPPRYFVLQVAGGIDMDFAAMDVAMDASGKPVPDPNKFRNPIAKLSTWKGTDVFSWNNWGNGLGLTLLCTEKVVELAAKEKWTNVRFDPIATS